MVKELWYLHDFGYTDFMPVVSFCRRVEAVLYCLTTYQVSVSSFVCRWVFCVSHHCCLIFFGAVTDWWICHDLVGQDLSLLFSVDDILCWRIQVSRHWFHTPSAAKNVMLSFSHACIVSFLVSAETFMFVRMRNWIMRSVSFFYFPPSNLFLWINSSISCVVQLNRSFCYHRELSGWVKGEDRVDITCLRVGNCATTSFGGNA